MNRLHIIIFGRVQGVFFRSNTQKQARKLNLTGWVRNNSDGTVEIVAEGSQEALKKFQAWCRKGPMFARVDEIKVKQETPKGEFTSFSVKYS
jgi:acylphosphatase